jgi:hypothetical protein
MSWLCFFGFHKWIYNSETERYCSKCGHKEIFIEGGPVSGMADDSYWKTVKKQPQK